jgi:hypothetical protein
MDEVFTRVWEQMMGRIEGPMLVRFVMQPLMAAILGVRAGLADARAHREPYLWAILVRPADRHQLVSDGWRDVRRVFALALVLDGVYQAYVFQWVYPLQSLVIAILLAVIPYVLVRGPAARVWRRLAPTR